MTNVKICGITNLEDARLSATFGADMLGFNFYQKSLRHIAPEKARVIVDQLPSERSTVGVFVNQSVEEICEIVAVTGLNAIQLHGEETPKFVADLKAKTGLEIIKVFRISPEFQVSDVQAYQADAVLLDTYSPHEYGGTGETFCWELAKTFRSSLCPIYLAGGLRTDNVEEAIRTVRPFAVDVASGVETSPGRKDPKKLEAFISKAKDA